MVKDCSINESWCGRQNFGIKAPKKVRWLQVVLGALESWEMQDLGGLTSLAISRSRLRPGEGMADGRREFYPWTTNAGMADEEQWWQQDHWQKESSRNRETGILGGSWRLALFGWQKARATAFEDGGGIPLRWREVSRLPTDRRARCPGSGARTAQLGPAVL